MPADSGPESGWQTTPHTNLIRYEPSGTYFARFRVKGKLFRRSSFVASELSSNRRIPRVIDLWRGAWAGVRSSRHEKARVPSGSRAGLTESVYGVGTFSFAAAFKSCSSKVARIAPRRCANSK